MTRAACDVLVVGAGPAGAAAALEAARRGLRVNLVDLEATPAARPGESLVPVVPILLAQLGVPSRALRAAVLSAYDGFHRETAQAPPAFQKLRDPAGRAARGVHVDRARLAEVLRRTATAAGVRLEVGTRVGAPLVVGGRVAGAWVGERAVPARWVVDATGRRAWLRHHLGLARRSHGPRRRVACGQVLASPPAGDPHPRFTAEAHGWSWVAWVGDGRCSWVRCSTEGAPLRTPPHPLEGLPPVGPHGAADLTWRSTRPLAGPGWLLAGEAGVLLEPSAGDGVARALEGGRWAAECVTRCLARPHLEALELARYDDQVMRAFEARVGQYSSESRELITNRS